MRNTRNTRNAPGIKDVAEKAGVSISTVSRVLNNSANVGDELKERVYRVIRETQYSVNPLASNLKSARRNQIAIVIPTLRRTYYTDIIKGISDYCYEQNVIPSILETDGIPEKEANIVFNLEKQWIDGIILIPGRLAEDENYREYRKALSHLQKRDSRIPVVLVEAMDLNPELDQIRVDHEAVTYAMTMHLLELGRKNLIYLGNAKEVPLYGTCVAGIRKAMREFGLELPDTRIINNNYTVMDGYRSMQAFLQTGEAVDGVICVNDQAAAGVLAYCREQEISIPREIAIIGFGGVALSAVTTPSITTMIVPRYEMGTTAAKMLFERIEGAEGEPKCEIIPGHLAVRESTMMSAKKRLDVMFAE